MYNRILVPLDGSALAEVALPHATAIARAFGARVILISVLQPAAGPLPYQGPLGPLVTVSTDFDTDVNGETEHAEEYMEQIEKRLQMDGVDVESSIRQGDPATEICETAEDNTDLIVMSTHGRTGLKRWVYGSVADRVLRSAKTPVLLVRAEFPD